MAITPYLLYEDAAAAIGWLKRAFGTRTRGKPMKDGNGVVRHAEVELDGNAILLGGPAGDYRNPQHSGGATVLLYIDAADVSKVFRRAVKAGAQVVESPRETPYGALRCAVADPEGHQWWFAQPLPKRASPPRALPRRLKKKAAARKRK
jgi:uncharacterized glyoxalase superfamily protein PhnB